MVKVATNAKNYLIDPVKFIKRCWPDINLYDKQKEILYSIRDNDETFVPAGNELGKDFVAALGVLWFFVSRSPAKVVTTSVQGGQLVDVLWAEIRRFLDTTRVKLPIQVNHLHLRKIRKDGTLEPRSSVTGQVVNQGESLLGRHLERGHFGIPTTMAVFDEASGMDDAPYESSDTWAHTKLIIGNPYPCENFFKKGVKDGDIKADHGNFYHRRVIKVTAEDSPNVRLAKLQISKGKDPTFEDLIPGVLSYREYLKRRKFWDSVRQCIGLDAEFYEGAEELLYPPEWLNRSELLIDEIPVNRRARSMGIDPAEGGDETVWTIIDEYGIIAQLAMRTSDTNKIIGQTRALMIEHNLKANDVWFDRGGGGKQHADRMRAQGLNVNTVGFGETAKSLDKTRRMKTAGERVDEEELRYTYKNRRAQMYHMLSMLLDPSEGHHFCIPAKYTELRRQLAPMPRLYDEEGKLYLPPKNRPRGKDKNKNTQTITDMLGCSPDRADSLVIAVYGMGRRKYRSVMSAI